MNPPQTMAIWDDILTETDRAVIRQGGYGRPRGLGERPALVIIDAQYNYCGENLPILAQIDRWPSGVGEAAWQAAAHLTRLLEGARRGQIPVIFTRQVQHHLAFDSFAAKADRDSTRYLAGAPGTRIIDSLTPQPGEVVIDKQYASAFFGTPLISYLIKLNVDTLMVTGGTTSGCVRSFCVDAVSHHFRVGVVEEAVFDRITASHKAALLDIWMKYADLLSANDAMDYLEQVRGRQNNLTGSQ